MQHLLNSKPTEQLATLCLGPAPSPLVRHFQMSLKDEDAVSAMLQEVRPQRIYHFAGLSRVSDEFSFDDYFSANFLSTTVLLEKIERRHEPVEFFFASSVHVYGNTSEVVTEGSPVHPQGPYGYTKYLAEEALRKKSQTLDGLRVIIGRLYNCIGPGQPPGFAASDLCYKVVDALQTGKSVIKTGPLTTYRRFLDVRDAVTAIASLFDASSAKCETYNIASERELQIGEILRILLNLATISPEIETTSQASANEFRGLRLSTERIRKILPGLTFRPIEVTLRDMVEWTKQHGSEMKPA